MRKVFEPKKRSGKGRLCHRCQELVEKDEYRKHQRGHRREQGGYGEGGMLTRRHEVVEVEEMSPACAAEGLGRALQTAGRRRGK